MPKEVVILNDFSGGLNTDKSSRALEDNELAVCTNLDPTSKGRVVMSRYFRNAYLAANTIQFVNEFLQDNGEGLLEAGFRQYDTIVISGAANGGNNITTTITAIAANQLTTTASFTTEAAGADVVIVHADGYVDQKGAEGSAVVGVTSGYGLATFANDYKISDSSAYVGEFLVKSDGAASGSTAIDILEDVNNWREGRIGTQSTTPCFYAAEGDLFVGGDHSSAPGSFTFHKQTQITSGPIAVAVWDEHTQVKAKPTAARHVIYESDNTGTDKAGAATIGQDDIYWIIKPLKGLNSGRTADGLWANDNDDTDNNDFYQYASSWLYKGGGTSDTHAESSLFETLGDGNTMAGASDWDQKAIQVQCWLIGDGGDDDTLSTVSQQLYGARLYVKRKDEGGDWYMLAEVNFEKGIKGSGETEWNGWEAATTSNPDGSTGNFSHAGTGDQCTTGDINAPPSLITYRINNGYTNADIPFYTAERRVHFKTGLIANSRAYIGNVLINGRTYGDRILKSPVFQYDVFTENSYLDVAINDGDQITALAAHADRILQFKHNAVFIINVSKETEFLEDEHQGAGVEWQAAVVTTPFGVVWINDNACYHYNGEKVAQLQLGKISYSDWSTNIDATKSIIGYDTKKQQIIILWDATSGGSGSAYIFDADTGSWFFTDHLLTQTVNCTNMVNFRGEKLLIGGGKAIDDINFLADPLENEYPAALAVELQTKVLDFGNPESKKNLLEVAVAYKNGNSTMEISVSADHASYVVAGSGSDYLNSGGGPHVKEFDTSGQAGFQGKKTFQIKLSGLGLGDFELLSITLTYRDLGVH